MIELEQLIGSTDGDLVLPIEPVRGRLGLIRSEVRRYLDERTVDGDPWLLVADELVANAVDATAEANTGTEATVTDDTATDDTVTDDTVTDDTVTDDTGTEATAGPAIVLSLAVHPARVVLTVANVGPAFELPAATAMPPPGAARGRGLPLVRALVDGIEVRRVEGVNIVACWRARPAGAGR